MERDGFYCLIFMVKAEFDISQNIKQLKYVKTIGEFPYLSTILINFGSIFMHSNI